MLITYQSVFTSFLCGLTHPGEGHPLCHVLQGYYRADITQPSRLSCFLNTLVSRTTAEF